MPYYQLFVVLLNVNKQLTEKSYIENELAEYSRANRPRKQVAFFLKATRIFSCLFTINGPNSLESNFTWSWLRMEAEWVLGLWLPEDEADEDSTNNDELSEELSELGLGAEVSTLDGAVCLQVPF